MFPTAMLWVLPVLEISSVPHLQRKAFSSIYLAVVKIFWVPIPATLMGMPVGYLVRFSSGLSDIRHRSGFAQDHGGCSNDSAGPVLPELAVAPVILACVG